MRTVRTIAEVRAAVGAARARGERVGFVPTMGYLHDGHLRLVDQARARSSCVVLSVFVNPTQFGPAEDFSRYPRDEQGDASKAESRGTDLFFAPELGEMYPSPPSVTVLPGALAERWEGEIRPGHFAGVLTVVAKLFNIVQPDVAVFGRKDLQQSALVRRMVRDLDMPVDIIVVPTVREADGLAMSSRNAYLAGDERARALGLVGSLRAAQEAFRTGSVSARAIEKVGRDTLARHNLVVDYFSLVDENELTPVERATPTTAAVVAARVGRTRLIDNAILGEDL